MSKKSFQIIGIEVVLILLLYMFINSKYMQLIPTCWVYDKTGLLCPACGGTRCIIYMLKGEWGQAFFSHSIFFIGILYLLTINIVHIINLNQEKKIATWIYPKYWYSIIFAILLTIYTIVRNIL